MLLGLPAQTSAGIACGRLIVDTGCGQDMVSDKTFTEYLLRANSKKRSNPLRMQIANGIVTIDKEVICEIKKFKEVTSAFVGKNTPESISGNLTRFLSCFIHPRLDLMLFVYVDDFSWQDPKAT